MQTFMAYKTYEESLRCLDYRRLGKQRVEAMQILNTLHGKNKTNAWTNHPCVKMWKDYILELELYHDMAIALWIERGYNNTMKRYWDGASIKELDSIEKPQWLTKGFCDSHRSNLLRKDKVYYSQFGWNIEDNLPYIWPR